MTAYPRCAACKNFIIAGGMVCCCWRMTMSLKDAEAQVRCPYWMRAKRSRIPMRPRLNPRHSEVVACFGRAPADSELRRIRRKCDVDLLSLTAILLYLTAKGSCLWLSDRASEHRWAGLKPAEIQPEKTFDSST